MIVEKLNKYSAESILPPMDIILTEALRQKPDFFGRVGTEKAIDFVYTVRRQMVEMQTKAHFRNEELPKTAAEANKIKAIIVISAPGTYSKSNKEDRYKHWPWSEWMDHRRIEYAAYLIRKITEMKTGESLTNNPSKFMEVISKEGPYLLYSGRPDEQDAITEALKDPKIHMPAEKVILIGGKIIDNTIDQAQRLYVPGNINLKPNDHLGFVLHSPQAVRFAYNIQAVVENNIDAIKQGIPEPFPSLPFRKGGPCLRMFPLPIPTNPITRQPSAQYPTFEICGLINYAFYAHPRTASETPFPYQF